jgi:hypothetical protein
MNEVVAPVTTAKASGPLEIAEGDMVFIPPTGNALSLTAGVAYPNSALAVASYASVADYFAGIALDSSANGDSDDIAIATTGVFELNLSPAATVKVGDAAVLCNPGHTGDGGNSCDCFTCSVEAAGAYTDDNSRIGTIVSKGTTVSTVLVKISSKVFNPNF